MAASARMPVSPSAVILDRLVAWRLATVDDCCRRVSPIQRGMLTSEFCRLDWPAQARTSNRTGAGLKDSASTQEAEFRLQVRRAPAHSSSDLFIEKMALFRRAHPWQSSYQSSATLHCVSASLVPASASIPSVTRSRKWAPAFADGVVAASVAEVDLLSGRRRGQRSYRRYAPGACHAGHLVRATL